MMEDSGHGVAPSQIQELFFPEDQPEKAPPTIGMGLSIARHYLIERLNANWLVAPGEHGGLKVEVKLEVPLQQFDNLRLRQIEDQLIGRQVLIVDDIKLNHKVLAKVLSGFHVESKSVTSGQEAIDICQLQQFDYILMDLRMPEMNGFEAAQRIIENGYEGSIIAVTAEKGGSTVSQALEAGMKDVIFKPVDFEEIKQSLITHMQAKS